MRRHIACPRTDQERKTKFYSETVSRGNGVNCHAVYSNFQD